MKKLLFLASIAVAQATFSTGKSTFQVKQEHFGLIKIKGHPKVKIGDTVIDNVLVRSAALLTVAGKLACVVPIALYHGYIKEASIYALAAPVLAAGSVSELITGPFQDIVRDGFESGMPETTIMNALDLW